MTKDASTLVAKLRRGFSSLRDLPRAFALVWTAARYWTMVWAILLLAVVTGLAARAIRAEGPCLLRSLLLFWLLKARGERAEFLIGVSKEASTLNSHAWFESHGNVLGDSAQTALHFATLLRF